MIPAIPKNIPQDLNAELLLSYLQRENCKVIFRGEHKRNAYQDLVDIQKHKGGKIEIGIGRHSLYNALPEFFFHPTERFGSLVKREDEKRFYEEYKQEEQEREDAYKFFAPMDLQLLILRLKVRERLLEYTETNKILLDIILGDSLSEKQKSNRFIRQAIPFLPSCKQIRGDKTLITLMLRKIFMEEGLLLEIHRDVQTNEDAEPRYDESLGASLDSLYVGNRYDQLVTKYDLHYWSQDDCDEHFLQFVNEVEEFRSFVQDYFMSVEEILRFDISHDGPALRLSDDMVYNYLNYNTNI